MSADKPRLPILNPAHPLARGLVGAWLFYETAGLTARDVSPNQRHATNGGGLSWEAGGLRGTGAANDYLVLGSPFTPMMRAAGGHLSVVLRLEFAANSVAFGERGPSNAGHALTINSTSMRYSQFGNWDQLSSALTLTPGTVYTVALTYDRQFVCFWLDGRLHSQHARNSLVNASTSPGGVLAYNYSGTMTSFTGHAQYLYAYNRALNATEIASLHADPYQAFRPVVPFSAFLTDPATITVRLMWTDHSSDEDGFSIERSSNGVTFVEIATVGAGVTQYDDSAGLASGQAYYYRLRAYRGSAYSDYSPTATVTTT